MSPLSPDLTAGMELTLRNLLAWSLQLGLVALAAAGLARLLPVDRPRARMVLGQTLLVIGLALPVLQPWHPTTASSQWTVGLVTAGPVAVGSGLASVPSPVPAAFWTMLIAAALAAGLTFQLARLSLGLRRLHALGRDARPALVPGWVDRLRAELAPRARFVSSERCGGPATFGLRRPTVVLPSAFTAMSPETQRAVVLHELVHARRGDWLALMGEEVLKAALFFHPAVHWLVGKIRIAREQCVDAEVVRFLGGRRSYLESLVAVARLSARAEVVPTAPFLRERHLRERVELLLKEDSMSRARTSAHLGATTGVLVLAGALAAAAFPMLGQPAGAVSGAAAAMTTTDVRDNDPEKGPAPAVAEKKPAPTEKEAFPAKRIHSVDPIYPSDAKEEGVQGLFIIGVKIDTTGRVADADVVASSPSFVDWQALKDTVGTPEAIQGDDRLAGAALDAVRQWRYEPVLDENGKPKEVEAILTVKFKLN